MEIHKKNQILCSFNDDHKLSHQSKHLLLELYRCDCEKLNDESFLRCTLNRASKLANATVLIFLGTDEGGFLSITRKECSLAIKESIKYY